MDEKLKPTPLACPDESTSLSATIETQLRDAFDALVQFCRTSDTGFRSFERNLLTRLFAVGCLLVRLFLTHRHEQLNPTPPAGFRRGDPAAPRTLKTLFGPVMYVRSQMIRCVRGSGFYPLDAVLG